MWVSATWVIRSPRAAASSLTRSVSRCGSMTAATSPSCTSRVGGPPGPGRPHMTEQAESKRAALVAAAQAQWVSALTDLGGRNTLLYYKDRRAGTLALAPADPAALDHLLTTGSIRLTRLFEDVDIRADAIRRVQAIYRKARELSEERGLSASYLATGMARWDELFLEPAAPVLLRGLTITPTRARHDDFDLTLDDASEVNPVLLHKLATVFGAEAGGLGGEPVTDPDAAYENGGAQLRRGAPDPARPGAAH